LLKSRTGRCGEFANAFCLICRSLGLDARYVLDFTDHVWVEMWMPSRGRYVHADPCERALDNPLMYEKGWNKNLSHVLSFSRHGVTDASPRYSRKFDEVLLRRSSEIVCESDARRVI
jgi:peptide-N4-(N-acetyl-beta-glucosaminyl)asparagine amidase